MKRALAILALTVLLLPCAAAAEEEERVYQLLDENGETVTWYAGAPEAGDEYIGENIRHYRVIQVDEDSGKARMESLGSFALPDVSCWRKKPSPSAW